MDLLVFASLGKKNGYALRHSAVEPTGPLHVFPRFSLSGWRRRLSMPKRTQKPVKDFRQREENKKGK